MIAGVLWLALAAGSAAPSCTFDDSALDVYEAAIRHDVLKTSEMKDYWCARWAADLIDDRPGADPEAREMFENLCPPLLERERRGTIVDCEPPAALVRRFDPDEFRLRGVGTEGDPGCRYRYGAIAMTGDATIEVRVERRCAPDDFSDQTYHLRRDGDRWRVATITMSAQY